MHLPQAWLVVPGLARQDLSAVYGVVPGLSRAAGDPLIGDGWELGAATALGVASDAERDPGVLADRIESRAATYLAECAAADPDVVRPWLVRGVVMRQSTLIHHLLNETVTHGYDIAQRGPRVADRA